MMDDLIYEELRRFLGIVERLRQVENDLARGVYKDRVEVVSAIANATGRRFDDVNAQAYRMTFGDDGRIS